jgi:hypothetical protein
MISCVDCEWSVEPEEMEIQADGLLCRRFPPTLTGPIPVRNLAGVVAPIYQSMLPGALPKGICGEFTEKKRIQFKGRS